MIVRDNPGSRRTVRYLGQTNSKVSKELEKLSSGYKINRAADDAAGLAVSEKMRTQITGLSRAKLNSQEGCNLIQTGEGALEEVHDMLNRASELADRSANGTYEDELDRENLQKELDNLCQEIDRISAGANFNGIKLFQDDGLEYERSPGTPTYPSADPVQPETKRTEQPQTNRSQTPEASRTAPVQTAPAPAALSHVAQSQTAQGNDTQQVFHIEYIEYDAVSTTQTPGGDNTLGKDMTVRENGVDKKLSDILKNEIIPNTVSNILNQYGAAFSYLTGSNIGMGLEYFSEGASGGGTVLAYVGAGFGYGGTTSGGSVISRTDSISYTLGVNVAAINPANWEGEGSGSRKELEATIAHEMIHAFMDEAATMGMSGNMAVDTAAFVQKVEKFPDWFIEGMAQTASGPGNWLVSSGGLNIDASSDAAAIKAAIASHPLGAKGNANDYGTGYLACMYLGAVIGGYNGADTNPQDMASTISNGLSQLLSAIIHDGKSMDTAIRDLTQGKSASFTSTDDFKSKFNSGSAAGMTDFVQSLLTATGPNGRGGVVSGDLSANNLTADTPSSNTLFELNPNTTKVTNTYPDGYNVYSGGAASVGGVAPSDNDPILPYIDFDNIRIYGVKDSNLVFDSTDGTLTIKAGAGIKITVRPSGEGIAPEQTHGSENVKNLILGSGVGGAALSGVNLSGSLNVQGGAEITYESDNSFGEIKLGGDTVFKGTGGLKTVTFDAGSHNAAFQGGAVVINRGSGAISNPGAVTVKGAAIAASGVTEAGGRSSIDIPWTPELDALGKLASIQIDGRQYDMSLDANQAAKLWLEPGQNHRVIFTDVDGKSKTLSATQVFEADGVTFQEFKWAAPARPYTVTGGQEGVDWEYAGPDGNTLLIKTNAEELTIGPGASLNASGQPVDENGNVLVGRIQLADGISSQGAPVKLTLDGISSKVSTGAAFDLGENNQVELTLVDGKANTFQGGTNYAGISVGDGTQLTINGNTGTLNATGGSDGAGIGRDGTATSDQTSSITINGGIINATGGSYGAGIGAGSKAAFGDITINGGTITATGGSGGAGIGGAYYSSVGDISIKDAKVTATSKGHGAGIGGGWTSSSNNGDIVIDGNSKITASSPEHGTGIGAGCQGTSGDITIKGNTIIELARGGNDGAGIGASWLGKCGDITIEGNATVKQAQGGSNGAGIGAGSDNSRVTGTIKIDTTGSVNATGGNSGVGIGSGYLNSSCGDIEIVQGTVNAKGSTDSTGIGAGRGSTSGNIAIGDSTGNKKVIVNADGGMSNDGGNIMSYTDAAHQNPGSVKIVGDNTSVKPGEAGEGKYSTSGIPADPSASNVSDLDDKDKLFSYPVYLFPQDPPPAVAETAGNKTYPLPLPADATNVQIKAKSASGVEKTWTAGLSHDPFEPELAYIWMTGEDQTLTITYDSPTEGAGTKTLDLKFYPGSGTFRTADQPVPPDAKEPGYSSDPTPPSEPDPEPSAPSTPSTPGIPAAPKPSAEPEPPKSRGGIILQIGANYGEILEVPRFYLSSRALGLNKVDISTQDNALASISILKDAINRVSSIRGEYGALQNRLGHNQNDLGVSVENLTDAESRIRDADMAEEYTKFVALSILQQTGQAMAAHSNDDANRVLQLLQ